MNNDAGASWLIEIRKKVGGTSKSVLAALDDLPTCDGTVSTWVDLRPNGRVAVYVLMPGLLHRLSGKLDSAATDKNPDDARESVCKYETFPITRAATFKATITVKTGPNKTRTDERDWTFNFGDRYGSVSVATPAEKPPAKPDRTLGEGPAEFARALAASIADASGAPAVP